MNKFTVILFALFVGTAHAEKIQDDFRNLGRSLKEAGREVGKKGKELGQVVGQETKRVGKDLADDSQQIRSDLKGAGKDSGHWFKDTFTNLGLQLKKTWKSWFSSNAP